MSTAGDYPTDSEDEEFEELMDEIRERNADRLGVTVEELDDMTYSEISRRIAAIHRAEYIRSRWFGHLRWRLLAKVYRRFNTRKLMFLYPENELDAIEQP